MTTKLTHIAKRNPAGRFSAVAHCGRLVNRLSLVSPESATCERCRHKYVERTGESVQAPVQEGDRVKVTTQEPGQNVREGVTGQVMMVNGEGAERAALLALHRGGAGWVPVSVLERITLRSAR